MICKEYEYNFMYSEICFFYMRTFVANITVIWSRKYKYQRVFFQNFDIS